MSAIDWLLNPEARRNQVAAGSASDDPAKPLTFVRRGEQERREQFQASRQNPDQPSVETPRQTTFTDGAGQSMGTRNTSYGQPSAMRTVGNAGASELPSVWETFKQEGLAGVRNRPDRRPGQYGGVLPATFTDQDADLPANPFTATGRAVTGPGTPPQGSARDVLRDAGLARRTPPTGFTGPTVPGGGRPSAVDGIFRREGEGGVPEFYNLRADGSAPAPLSRGTVSYVPAGSLANMTTPQANVDAVRAAAARGDWAALERIGAIDQRAPVGGGSRGPRVGSSGQFARADQLMARADDLYSRADRASSDRERSRYLTQARAMMGMAENAQGGAVTMAGQQAGLDQEAMRQNAALQERLAGKPMSGEDMASMVQKLASAGYDNTRARQIAQEMAQPSPFTAGLDIDADTLQAYTMAYGPKGAQILLAQRDLAQRLGSPEDIQRYVAMYQRGELEDMPQLVDALKAAGHIRGFAEGGLVTDTMRDQVGFEDGGFVDDPMMMDPEMMDPMMTGQGVPGMGAMDAAGMGAGTLQADPVQMEYAQYAQVAESMGLPVIPFEQFAQIMQQVEQAEMPPEAGAISFAKGGPVDVGGKMVVDTNPAAATDSIPAMIDGTRPAALDSGEFVWPDDVVRFYGTDKLSKMMEAARKGPEDASIAR